MERQGTVRRGSYTAICSQLNSYKKSYMNPALLILNTPSQNFRYSTAAGHCAVGKWAIGNRNPPSLRNTNCSMCVAIETLDSSSKS